MQSSRYFCNIHCKCTCISILFPKNIVIVYIYELEHKQSQSLVQLSGQSLSTVTQHGHPDVVVAGQQDVASSRLWWVAGQDGGLHGVEDEDGRSSAGCSHNTKLDHKPVEMISMSLSRHFGILD